MENNDKALTKKVAQLTNLIFKTLYMLLTIITLSVGLYFYFVVGGAAGYGIGVAMFVVTALVFVAGELMFYANMKCIKEK